MLMRWKDSPEPLPEGTVPPGNENKVMHASLRIGDTTVMASDGCATGATQFQGISLSLGASSDAEAKRLFDGLSDGGQVQMPLGETFFASQFGMVADRFGVSWMVIHDKPHCAVRARGRVSNTPQIWNGTVVARCRRHRAPRSVPCSMACSLHSRGYGRIYLMTRTACAGMSRSISTASASPIATASAIRSATRTSSSCFRHCRAGRAREDGDE